MIEMNKVKLIRRRDHNIFEIECTNISTVYDIKTMLNKHFPQIIRITYKGKIIHDDTPISSLGSDIEFVVENLDEMIEDTKLLHLKPVMSFPAILAKPNNINCESSVQETSVSSGLSLTVIINYFLVLYSFLFLNLTEYFIVLYKKSKRIFLLAYKNISLPFLYNLFVIILLFKVSKSLLCFYAFIKICRFVSDYLCKLRSRNENIEFSFAEKTIFSFFFSLVFIEFDKIILKDVNAPTTASNNRLYDEAF